MIRFPALGAVKKQLILFIHFFTAPYAVDNIELYDLILNYGLQPTNCL